MSGERVALALGARNLGGAIVDHLQANGWRCAGVEYPASQEQRAYTHELVLTPSGDTWVP